MCKFNISRSDTRIRVLVQLCVYFVQKGLYTHVYVHKFKPKYVQSSSMHIDLDWLFCWMHVYWMISNASLSNNFLNNFLFLISASCLNMWTKICACSIMFRVWDFMMKSIRSNCTSCHIWQNLMLFLKNGKQIANCPLIVKFWTDYDFVEWIWQIFCGYLCMEMSIHYLWKLYYLCLKIEDVTPPTHTLPIAIPTWSYQLSNEMNESYQLS